jgi:hypothetical protein
MRWQAGELIAGGCADNLSSCLSLKRAKPPNKPANRDFAGDKNFCEARRGEVLAFSSSAAHQMPRNTLRQLARLLAVK